jgi:glucose/mannose transport system substrate-binding protein
MRKNSRLAPVAMTAAAALFSMSVGGALAGPLDLEVIHNWTSGGERNALDTIASAYEAAGGTWIDTATADSQVAVTTTRVMGGDPPGSAKFNTGYPMDQLYQAGLLDNVDDVAAAQDWKSKLPAFIWEAITRDGHVVAVPINLQSHMFLWYSKEVLEKSGVTGEPQSYDELFAALDKIKAAGFIPLALGGQPWQEAELFNKVTIGVAGPQLYYDLYQGDIAAAVASEAFAQVVDVFGRLRGYVDPGSPGRSWPETTNLVISGKAGFQVMGDWAKGEFSAAGMTPGVEYGCMEGPGNKAVILDGDVFIFPKNPEQREGQLKLAEVLLSPELQVAFNKVKGSMPVRLDTDVSTFDACAQAAMASIQKPEDQVPHLAFFLSDDTRAEIDTAISVFWNDPNATAESFGAGLVNAIESTK